MTEIRPIAGFEEDYARYVERKARVEEEIKIEREAELQIVNEKYDNILNERTLKLDKLIAETSEIVEIPDPVVEENYVEESANLEENAEVEENHIGE